MKMCIKNPVSNEFVNPFSKKVEELSKKFDNATISRDYDELERLLSVAESELSNENIASQSRIHYSMGTVYSDFAQFKDISTEKSIEQQSCYRIARWYFNEQFHAVRP